MKILYIHQYFKTPEEGGAIRSYYIAKGLIDHGFDVEMITAHNNKYYELKIIEGIKVHYLPVPYFNSMGFFARIKSFLKFNIKAILHACKIKHVDLIYVTSTPLTVGCISIFLKKWNNIPFVFEVRDLWPEAPIQMGIIKNTYLKLFLYWLERKIYTEAKAIIALSPGIRDYIKIKATNAPVYMIPNMADLEFFGKSINIDDQADTNKPFIITYFGAIGKVNRIYSLIDMAKESQKFLPHIKFVIIGDGAELSKLKYLVTMNRLSNIEVHNFKTKKQLQELLKNSDASYISYEDVPILETSSPNKFFDSITAGKLIILNIKGWLLDLSEKNNCGIYFNPKIPGDFIAKISPFVNDRQLLKDYQYNALKLAKEFSKEVQIKQLVNIFRTLK